MQLAHDLMIITGYCWILLVILSLFYGLCMTLCMSCGVLSMSCSQRPTFFQVAEEDRAWQDCFRLLASRRCNKNSFQQDH